MQENLPPNEAAHFNSRLYNADLAPAQERRWNVYSILTMWMSDVHSIGGYTFAAGLFFLGLAGWQVLIAEIIGALLVFTALNLTGTAGTKLGVPFPVLSRIAFGLFGGNIPALIRAVVAIAWYGIQTYLASIAVDALLIIIDPALKPLVAHTFLGLSELGWIGFIILWVVQLLITYYGMEVIRRYDNFAGPAVYVALLLMIIWIVGAAHGDVNIFRNPSHISSARAVLEFFSAIALVVAYFSTLILNVCDFTRFSPSIKTTRRGNFWGIPVNFTAFSIASVIVTVGTIKVYGHAITDPVLLVQKIPNHIVLVLAAVVFILSTIGINIVANLVSPAYDLSNLAPKYINFRTGGAIAAILSVIVMPWKIYANPFAVNYFLGALAAFLGPIFGVIVVDYYLIKRSHIDVLALYNIPESPYWYAHGFNPRAVVSFLVGAIVSAIIALLPQFAPIAPFSWFIGVGISGGVYLWIMKSGVPQSKGPGEIIQPVSTTSR